MSSTVEKVRDAIETELRKRADGEHIGPYIDRAARAAIDAMREPDDRMIEAGRQSFRDNGLLPSYTDTGGPGQTPLMAHMLYEAWPKMITAALEDK